ncbi:TetR family transcriptional regulator [Tumebacillus sp. BK434]|uniref:TetR/AcrR family transcriptional regulator n=1 Tax=Tumebacillus sp. BK434 TaxID=2512169 RepID=UPI0010501950|nr:TetR/AcrR family transcriptional regulator [Tumebacillus sp. BK434]TCP55774.1 TetR family transcriptional regulator [Tumebacillus sp. BK434]
MPRSKKELRAEETKQAIILASGQLFAKRGFEKVTMREIAKEAGCSHTAIYLYFKDKEALLHQLAMGPLQALLERFEEILQEKSLPPAERLRTFTREFIRFNLTQRSLYNILFMTRASRVDVEEQELAVQRLRNRLFDCLRSAIKMCLPGQVAEERILAYARIYFYTLHGIVGTYLGSDETDDMLLERLGSTFELAVDVMLAGFQQTLEREWKANEN